MVRGLARWWIDYERRGVAVPSGPVVVAANHYSHIDPVMVSLAIGRPVRYLAVDELFGSSRFFDSLTHWLGAIPMSRTRAPLGALRTALAELEGGGVIGLFPEGVRVWVWGETEPKRGAAWLARRAGVPLVPVAIAGTDQVLGRDAHRIHRSPVTVVVCDAIEPGDHPGKRDAVAAMTEEWRRRVGAALRAVHAGEGR